VAEIDAYNEALQSGQYQKPTGLSGKYDNARRFWEDEQLGLYLRPYLERLVDRKKEQGKKLRVLDVGCGSGDGFELLTSIKDSRAPITSYDSAIVGPDTLGLYKGIDINEGLLKQAQSIYGGRDDMVFVRSDFNNLEFDREEPFDLYTANYGTLSHNTDEQTIDLLANIAQNSKDGAIILVDWLGRFAYEWQTLWTRDYEDNQWMDYVISYIRSGDKDKKQELTSFPLRIMGRGEVLQLYRKAKKRAGGRIALVRLADRSSFVGRHIDTAQYNPHCQPLRQLVNSLFEPNVSTNLDELVIRYVPREGFAEVNDYHQRLVEWWNYLVAYTQAGLAGRTPAVAPASMPLVVRTALSTMRRVLAAATRTKIGSPRASLAEPQLAYCLREIEMGIQRGIGCGHGLVAIFEVGK
jgi:ubiquinone/menaquinone biosynthesis C-methylase UbiE